MVTRLVYTRPPQILDLPSGLRLILDWPLYGLPESGLHCFITHNDCLKTRLSMSAAIHNPCLLFTPRYLSANCCSSVPQGVTTLQTEETLYLGSEYFSVSERHSPKRITCKPKTILADDQFIKFSGGTFCLSKDIVTLHHPADVNVLQKIKTTNVNQSSYISP